VRIVVLASVVATLSGLPLAADEPEGHCPPEFCERLWAIDQTNLRWIADLVRAKSLRVTELDALARRGELLPASEARDLGFGARRRDFRLPAHGNLDFTLRVVEHEGRVSIASFRTEIRNAEYVALWPYFEWKELGSPAAIGQPTGGGMEIRFEDAAVEWDRAQALEAELGRGPYAPPRGSEEFVASHALSDPLADLHAGDGCGESTAALHIAALVEAGAWERLGAVLRGANPEGRLLAYRAFDSRPADQVDEATRRAMARIRDDRTPIRLCDGGTIRLVAALAALDRLATSAAPRRTN
jgi:hypothetical protein